MSTPFSTPINIFLNDIDDTELALYTSYDLKKYLDDLLITSANADFIYCNKTKNLSNYTASTFSGTTLVTDGSFSDTLTTQECNIIAKYMLLRYLNTKIHSEDVLRIALGDKDYSMTSNHMTLSALLKLKESTLEDIKNLRFDYIYYGNITSDDLS